jgi:hypothetical protein
MGYLGVGAGFIRLHSEMDVERWGNQPLKALDYNSRPDAGRLQPSGFLIPYLANL